MQNVDLLFAGLRRRPDVEAPNLFAVDAADRLMLDVAADALAAASAGSVAVIGDNYGALTLGAATRFGLTGIRVRQDDITAGQALDANAADAGLLGSFEHHSLDRDLLDGVRIVLLRMPRSLAELDEVADAVARYADPMVEVFAGGRDKHMTLSMNDVLGRFFVSVAPTRGRQKSRVIVASQPLPVGSMRFPVEAYLDDVDMHVVAHGGVFAGARLDIGTRLLLGFLPQMRAASHAIDLGCGAGILAVGLARRDSGCEVIASDRSAAAVASAIATAAANDVEITAMRDDALATVPDVSAELIVCNPPFHLGSAVHAEAAMKLFDAAARVLVPGGELWTVYNSHLNYRGTLQRTVGRTSVEGQSRKFTVTRSVRRAV